MKTFYDKHGNANNFAMENDITRLKYMRGTGINTTGNKIEIHLKITKNGNDDTHDKATVFVFGTHNTVPFCGLIYVYRGTNKGTAISLHGDFSLSSVTQYDDYVKIRLNTSIYGSAMIFSTCEIINAFGAN